MFLVASRVLDCSLGEGPIATDGCPSAFYGAGSAAGAWNQQNVGTRLAKSDAEMPTQTPCYGRLPSLQMAGPLGSPGPVAAPAAQIDQVQIARAQRPALLLAPALALVRLA